MSAGFSAHLTNASPVYPSGQLHIGTWFNTLHWALSPQDPGQGSLHLFWMQAWLLGQSEFIEHSGLHVGGDPMKEAKQAQEACSFTTRQSEFGPHGEGMHGFENVGVSIA